MSVNPVCEVAVPWLRAETGGLPRTGLQALTTVLPGCWNLPYLSTSYIHLVLLNRHNRKTSIYLIKNKNQQTQWTPFARSSAGSSVTKTRIVSARLNIHHYPSTPRLTAVADFDGDDDFDDETAGNLHRDIEAAEGDEKNPQGRPGSFLNRLISHGNKKTQDDILRESQDTREGQRQ